MTTRSADEPTGALMPWRALRYAAGADLARVTAPPYDAGAPSRLAQHAAGHPRSVVRLVIPEMVEPDGHADAERLVAWRADLSLAVDDHAALWQVSYGDDHTSVRGAMGLIDALAPGVTFPHEGVIDELVDRQTDRLEARGADLEPVVLIPTNASALERPFSRIPAPVDHTLNVDGTWHAWGRLDDAAGSELAQALAGQRFLIADGHHRLAAHQRLATRARQRGDVEAAQRWRQVLAVVIDQARHPLRVDPVHRVVPAVSLVPRGLPEGWWWTPVESGTTVGADEIRVVTGGEHRLLTHGRRCERSVVELLHDELIDHWGVAEQWHPVLSDSARAIDQARETGGTALLLPPTPLPRVVHQALRGQAMPAKSTAFSPKPRLGLLMRDLADESDGR